VQRDLAAILFYEDGVFQSPYSHTGDDTVGLSLNSDELFLGNVRAAASTILTLARPIAPDPILLMLHRNPGDDVSTVRLDWTGGYPAYDLHRLGEASVVRDDAHVIAGELRDTTFADTTATGSLLFYSVEEYP
jgi:hypothetical protein